MNGCLTRLTEWTWDWPLDHSEGEVHCKVADGRFYAEFVFADLRPDKIPVMFAKIDNYLLQTLEYQINPGTSGDEKRAHKKRHACRVHEVGLVVYTFDNLKGNFNSYSIGLCPIREKEYPTFCRLEIQAIPLQQSISVLAYRELFRYESVMGTAPKTVGSLRRSTRKVYRLPDHVKMNTLTIKVLDQGVIKISAECVDLQ